MGKFNVLWIDDQPRKCKRAQIGIESSIKENGLTPYIKFIPKASKDELFGEDTESNKLLKSRDYDLLFLDYKLIGNLFGNDVISTIREKYKIFVDIILYSSAKNEMIKAVKDSFDEDSSFSYLDNIYIIPLGDEFQTKAKRVINKIVGSWYNAHSIRGVVLAKTSKFEELVSEIIRRNYLNHTIQIKEVLKEKGKNVLVSLKGKWDTVYSSSDPVDYVLKNPVSFNWAVKEKILDYLIEKQIIMINENEIENMKYLFNLRNDFAHNQLKIENGECHLFIKDEIRIYKEEDIRDIRDKISSLEKHLENLII